MNTKKILSLFIVITMVLTSIMCFDFFTVFAKESEKSTYERFEESVSAENGYGLPNVVDSGKILNAWNWSYENTTELLETIAQLGFGAIQVSPPSEVKMPTKGMHFIETSEDEIINGWWMFYQNVAFRINQSEDNALGTKADFEKLCEEAQKYGIKIIPEVIVNHMANNDDYIGEYDVESENPMDHLSEKVAEFEPEIYEKEAFHTPFKPTEYIESYWQSTDDSVVEESLTQHAVSDYKLTYNPDLATETKVVQDAVYEYLAELVEAGADGFCFDEVKHVETQYDTYFPSDFWENTLVRIRYEYPEIELYAYGTVFNKLGDGRDFSEYTELMDITDTVSYWGIMDSVYTTGNALPRYEYNRGLTQDKVVQYSENFETYIYGASSYLSSLHINKIWALTAARKDITGVYFARPDERIGRTREDVEKILSDTLLGEANITAWANPEVKAVNQFDNFFGDCDELLTVKDNCALVERYNVYDDVIGATVVRLKGNSAKIYMKTKNLNDATYVDVISGNEFTVSDGVLVGEVGDTGIACLYCIEYVNVKPYYVNLPLPDDFPSSSQGCFWEPVGYYTVVMSVRPDTDDLYVYAFNAETGEWEHNWPGIRMNYAYENEYGELVFYAYIPKEYNTIIINNNGNWQTIDMTITESLGIYIKGDGTFGSYEPCFRTWPVPPIKTQGLRGDAEKDDSVNIRDATVIQKYLADLEVKDFEVLLADANCDGEVDVRDATAIQRYLVGFIDYKNEYVGKLVYYD